MNFAEAEKCRNSAFKQLHKHLGGQDQLAVGIGKWNDENSVRAVIYLADQDEQRKQGIINNMTLLVEKSLGRKIKEGEIDINWSIKPTRPIAL